MWLQPWIDLPHAAPVCTTVDGEAGELRSRQACLHRAHQLGLTRLPYVPHTQFTDRCDLAATLQLILHSSWGLCLVSVADLFSSFPFRFYARHKH